METDTPRRRWFQFALWELVVLMSLLGIVCAFAATWPVNDPRLVQTRADTYFFMQRLPTAVEIGCRVVLCSAGVLVAWLVGRATFRFLHDDWQMVRRRRQEMK